jgi:hypothetical protein
VLARTREWRAVFGLAWSADGRDLWYSAGADEDRSYMVRALTPGGRERIVCRLPGLVSLYDIGKDGSVLLGRASTQVTIRGRVSGWQDERELGWLDGSYVADLAAGGRTMLFTEAGVAGGKYYSACLRTLDGSNPVRLGEGSAQSLSPDGTRVLAIDLHTPNRLAILNVGSGNVDSLPPAGLDRYVAAGWLPDGKRVVFYGNPSGQTARTWVQALGEGLARPVTPPGVFAIAPSPDGRFVAGATNGWLTLYPVEGDEPKTVAKLDREEQVVKWSADGRGLFVSQAGPEMRVTRIEIASGKRTPYVEFKLADPAGVDIRNAVLTSDGSGYAFTYLRTQDELFLVKGLR